MWFFFFFLYRSKGIVFSPKQLRERCKIPPVDKYGITWKFFSELHHLKTRLKEEDWSNCWLSYFPWKYSVFVLNFNNILASVASCGNEFCSLSTLYKKIKPILGFKIVVSSNINYLQQLAGISWSLIQVDFKYCFLL